MRLAIDERASEDLDDIAAWITKDHPEAAREMIEQLLTAMQRLAELPRLGRKGRVSDTYEWVVAPYIIVYSAADDGRYHRHLSRSAGAQLKQAKKKPTHFS